MLTEQQKQHYREEGFVLLRGVVPLHALAQLEARGTGYAAELRGGENDTLSSATFAQALLAERGLERRLYDGMRTFPWLQEVGRLPQLTEPVSELFGEPAGLLEKIPMRLDLPHIVRELAVWCGIRTTTTWAAMRRSSLHGYRCRTRPMFAAV